MDILTSEIAQGPAAPLGLSPSVIIDQRFWEGRDFLYGLGKRVINYEQAAACITQSAKGGQVLANGLLATMLIGGDVIPRDMAAYQKLLNSDYIKNDLVYLANHGNPIAQTTIASLIRHGFDPSRVEVFRQAKKNHFLTRRAKAVASFTLNRLAAEQGLPEAFVRLAWCLSMGVGVTANQVEAFHNLKQAGVLGLAQAQWALGELHLKENGEVVDVSSLPTVPDQGRTWKQRALKQGYMVPGERALRLPSPAAS